MKDSYLADNDSDRDSFENLQLAQHLISVLLTHDCTHNNILGK